MGARLQSLHELQDIELQIVDIRRQLERKERLVVAQNKKLESAKAAVKQQQEEIRRSQADFNEIDVDVKGRTSHISKLREALNSVKTNKEYAAILQQMNNEKADVTRLETRAMELLEGVESRKAALTQLQTTEQAEQQRVTELQADLDQMRKTLADRMNRLAEQRKRAAAALDADTIKLFERLSERYEGEVMAEVGQPNPRRDEFVCNGCHIGLRPDVVNALRVRDEVSVCKSCGRILFLASS